MGGMENRVRKKLKKGGVGRERNELFNRGVVKNKLDRGGWRGASLPDASI